MEFPEPDKLQAVIHQHVLRFPFSGCCLEEISGYAREKLSLKANLAHQDHPALLRDPGFAERVSSAIIVLMHEEKIRQSFEDDIVRYRCV